VLAELYSGLGKPDERDRLFALAELSFAHAEAVQNRSYYLSSAVFAYAFLFPENPIDAPDPYDPRLRLALDLYNQDLAPLESHCCILISGALERPGSRGLMNSRAGHARFEEEFRIGCNAAHSGTSDEVQKIFVSPVIVGWLVFTVCLEVRLSGWRFAEFSPIII